MNSKVPGTISKEGGKIIGKIKRGIKKRKEKKGDKKMEIKRRE